MGVQVVLFTRIAEGHQGSANNTPNFCSCGVSTMSFVVNIFRGSRVGASNLA